MALFAFEGPSATASNLCWLLWPEPVRSISIRSPVYAAVAMELAHLAKCTRQDFAWGRAETWSGTNLSGELLK